MHVQVVYVDDVRGLGECPLHLAILEHAVPDMQLVPCFSAGWSCLSPRLRCR